MNPNEKQRLADALAGRYTIEEEVGRGGMAIVYRAVDLKHDRRVAIKVLKPELAQALGPDRFLREIKLTAQLSHPHILPLLDSGEAHGVLYYVMPFVEGESLRDRLRREHRLPVDEALTIAREVSDALDSAHRHGVIHRDIKPENILLEEGHAVIADFGIARAIAESAGERLTATGVAVGTPAYMSPEQMSGESEVGSRSDIYALACVVYELLAGDPPFDAPTAQAVFARRLTGPVPHVSQARPGVSAEVDRALRRALAAAPDERYSTAAEFATALLPAAIGTPEASAWHALRRLARTPRYAIAGLGVLAAAVLAVAVPLRARMAREHGRTLLSRALQLADSNRFVEAYNLATRADQDLPGDSGVARLMPRVADQLSVTSEPPGAQVFVERFTPDAHDQPRDSVSFGVTPIHERRLARGDYRVVIAKDGFVPVERMASSHRDRETKRALSPISISVTLLPSDRAPRDMVFVPGGSYQLRSPDLPVNLSTPLGDYWIDTYEVTNEAYKAFVTAGGYRKPEYWTQGQIGTAAWQRLRDRTGMAGPRSWAGQDYPAGRARYPVTDVSWYEATAYCAFMGKALPTVFQWEKAARNGVTTSFEGVMMPWGYVAPGEATALRANFSGSGPAPVDAYRFGISAFGAYGMAGNVKEWTANQVRDGYGVTGGSWQDPIYLYSDFGSVAPTASAADLGFRCAKVVGQPAGDQGAFQIHTDQRTPRYAVLGPVAFQALLSHYRYDRRPLDAHIIETIETPDWVRQEISYVALETDTALAYLYLPKQAAPPFQTMLYIASSGAFSQHTVPEDLEYAIGPNIKAGRAALAVVLKGMAGRSFGPGWQQPAPSSVRFRDLLVLNATEVRRAIDYLETRSDIDMRRLSYVGLSFGAGSRLIFAAVDDRFHAVVLIGGGIDERMQPTLPEAANFNFAPYIKPPKLLLNGRDDEEHPWFTRALPLWNLLREPKKLVLVDGAGHVPPVEARVPAINQFLDQTLGPVVRNH
ncbi:MAG TPA: bifunctional serine/threonine-protein kinase/formylglycine-generating enzyme family protein [Gemmatimonadales bacterium]|nr:bifunctional serine/threonine-protein kinase/formylglycine-generating enzyme family protein [Gemmatimonadales bacterium]